MLSLLINIIPLLCYKVDIGTGYGLDGLRIESRWRRDFRTCPDRPWGPPSLLYNGDRVFPGGKERPGWSRNSRTIPLLPLWAVRPLRNVSACTTVHFTFTFFLQNSLWSLVSVQHLIQWKKRLKRP